VSLVQANRVRQFARAAGILAKSDIIDATVLVRFGAAMQPALTPAQPAHIARLRELDAQRRHLSRLLSAEQNRLAQLRCAEIRIRQENWTRTYRFFILPPPQRVIIPAAKCGRERFLFAPPTRRGWLPPPFAKAPGGSPGMTH